MTMPPQNLEVGVAVLATQMTEVIKDVSDLRQELRDHRQEHKDSEREAKASRLSARRWAIGLAVTGLGAVGGLYGWVAVLLHK